MGPVSCQHSLVGELACAVGVLLRRCAVERRGGVRERPNRHDWKSCVGKLTVGSNPTASASRRILKYPVRRYRSPKLICSTRSFWRSLAERCFGRCDSTFVGVTARREPPLGRERSSGGSSFPRSEVDLGRHRMQNDFLALVNGRDPGQAVVMGLALGALALGALVLGALGEWTSEGFPRHFEASVRRGDGRGHHQAGLDNAIHTTLPRDKPASDSPFSAPKCGSTLLPRRP